MHIPQTPPEQLGHLKSVWDSHSPSWLKEHIDPRFFEFMEKLNNHPELATMYHCSGHIPGEASAEPNSVASYLVLASRGETTNRLMKMVETVMRRPDYIIRKTMREEIMGWEFEVSDTPVTPWYHGSPYLDMRGAPTLVLRFRKLITEDPTGNETVRIWNELFDQHIFNI